MLNKSVELANVRLFSDDETPVECPFRVSNLEDLAKLITFINEQNIFKIELSQVDSSGYEGVVELIAKCQQLCSISVSFIESRSKYNTITLPLLEAIQANKNLYALKLDGLRLVMLDRQAQGSINKNTVYWSNTGTGNLTLIDLTVLKNFIELYRSNTLLSLEFGSIEFPASVLSQIAQIPYYSNKFDGTEWPKILETLQENILKGSIVYTNIDNWQFLYSDTNDALGIESEYKPFYDKYRNRANEAMKSINQQAVSELNQLKINSSLQLHKKAAWLKDLCDGANKQIIKKANSQHKDFSPQLYLCDHSEWYISQIKKMKAAQEKFHDPVQRHSALADLCYNYKQSPATSRLLAELFITAKACQLDFIEHSSQKFLVALVLLEQAAPNDPMVAHLSMQAFANAIYSNIHPTSTDGCMFECDEPVHISFDTAMFHCYIVQLVNETMKLLANQSQSEASKALSELLSDYQYADDYAKRLFNLLTSDYEIYLKQCPTYRPVLLAALKDYADGEKTDKIFVTESEQLLMLFGNWLQDPAKFLADREKQKKAQHLQKVEQQLLAQAHQISSLSAQVTTLSQQNQIMQQQLSQLMQLLSEQNQLLRSQQNAAPPLETNNPTSKSQANTRGLFHQFNNQ